MTQVPLLQPIPLRSLVSPLLLEEEMNLNDPSQTISQILRPRHSDGATLRASVSQASFTPPALSPTEIQMINELPTVPTAPRASLSFARQANRNKSGKVSNRRWFLTYPQNETSKETVFERLQALPYGLEWCLISRETHQDGGLHLHVLVAFTRKIFARDLNRIFDPIAAKHGDYQVMISPYDAVVYLQKEDPSPLKYGNLPTPPKEKKRKAGCMDTIAAALVEGKTIRSLVPEFGGAVMLHHPKMKSFQALVKAHGQTRQTKTALMTLTCSPTGDSAEQTVHQWLRDNMGNRMRPHKMMQLYIEAPTNHNKSSLIIFLSKYFKPYMMPQYEHFDDHYDDEIFDFIVLDEFSSKTVRPIQYLNAFVEGIECPVRTKGGQNTKFVNLPVIILSNFPPTCLWKEEISLFHTRFIHVTLTAPLDLSLITVESTPIPGLV